MKLDKQQFAKMLSGAYAPPIAIAPAPRPAKQQFGGADLDGWTTTVGDSLWLGPYQSAVSMADIDTSHYGDLSELRANIQQRAVMVHNRTFFAIDDVDAFEYAHHAGFQFRLPYRPNVADQHHNARAIQGGLFIWDGVETNLTFGVAFQWLLNPAVSMFGEVRVWVDTNGGKWMTAGYVEPDTEWHDVTFDFDFSKKMTRLQIDGKPLLSSFGGTPQLGEPAGRIQARLQTEIISMWPGPAPKAPQHRAEFRQWYWDWQPQ